MSVHIYKYGLQWLYGRNVYSGINVQLCVYCVHFWGIDIHEQEIPKFASSKHKVDLRYDGGKRFFQRQQPSGAQERRVRRKEKPG